MSEGTKAVFLSYASQDSEAAKRICEALRAAGVEVWFDQSELVGGDAWDQKIRKQIGSCALFVPIISANTQARAEGYFRLEWKLADRRTDLIGKSKAFLLPVCIDDTRDSEADVPDSFLTVQWTRLPAGETTPAFCERVKKLLNGDVGRGLRTPPSSDTAGFGDPALQSASRQPMADMDAGRPRPALRARWPWIVGAIAALAVGYVVVSTLNSPWYDPAKVLAAMAEQRAAVPGKSPARQLADQALTVALTGSSSLEQLRAAGAIADKAALDDPLDGEIWAIAALVDLSFYESGIDVSEKRRDALRMKLRQAKGLAPRASLTRYAEAKTLVRVEPVASSFKAGEEILRDLLDSPTPEVTRKNVLSMLVAALEEQRRFAEAASMAEDGGMWGGAFWSYLRAGDLPQAMRMAERQTEKDLKDGLYLQIAVQFARGDIDAWAAALDRLPATAMLEEQALSFQLWLAYYRRDPAALMAVARRFPDDYIDNAAIKGARGGFIGQAHQWAGRTEAARAAWTEALQLVERRLAAEPSVGHLQMSRVSLLAMLGRKDEAAQLLGLFRQQNQDPWMAATLNGLLMLLDRHDEALDELEKVLRANPRPYWHLHTVVRYSDTYDPLRGNPRFEKLLRDTLLPGAKPFEDPKPAGSAAIDAKSVAVLAFANLSEDKSNEYFSDGISEELLNVLAKVPGLKVSARTSAFFFKGKEVPIPEIARQLGVAYVVEGSVRKQGDKVRIAAQLIKAADGFHVWSDTFTRDLKDIFAVQDEIAGLIAKNLQLTLGESARSKKVVNPEAHQFVLQGRHFWALRGDANLATAEDAYRRALALDPSFAEAHAGMADVWMIRAWYRAMADGGPEVTEELSRARLAVQRATELDPSLAEPYATLGTVLHVEGKFAEVEGPFARALELNPNYAVGHHWHAVHTMAMGRFDECLDELRLATQLDPLAPMPLWTLAAGLNIVGEPAEALAAADRALSLRSGFAPLLAEKALAALALGRREEAVAAARAIVAAGAPRWWADADATYVLRTAGLEEEAQRQAERFFSEVPPSDYRRCFVLAALGRTDEALALRSTVPSTALIRVLASPIWDPVREDPRFKAWVEALDYSKEYQSGLIALERRHRQRNSAR